METESKGANCHIFLLSPDAAVMAEVLEYGGWYTFASGLGYI